MGRGGKVGCNTNFRRRGGRWTDRGSDDSDEDYVVSDEKGVMSDESEDCGSFLDDSASEKSFGDYGDGERKVAARKVARAKPPMGFSGRRKRTGLKVSRRREVELCDDGDDDDGDEDYGVRRVKASSKRKRELSDDEDDDYDVSGKASPEWQREFCDDDVSVKASPKRKRELHDDDDDDDDNDEDYAVNDDDDDVSVKASPKRKRDLRDDDNDEDYVVNDDDDVEEEEEEEFTPEDEDFTVDDDDCLDEEEECRVTKKVHTKKVGGPVRGRKGPVRGRKRRKRSNSSRVLKKPLQKKGVKRRRLRRTVKSDDGSDGVSASIDKIPAVREKSRKKPTGRSRRKHVVQSNSDFASSGSSDFDYTISEEEREQIREASELCREITVNLRSSSSSKKIEDDSFLGQLKWPPRRKGKEKIEEAKIEVGKQICGICLTEEDRRRVRGTLNCCSHYFCFTCIMAWSKVETRCPLCKQRFQSISKPARSSAGVDLRTMVMQVPERDQVYQPSEEEIRSYFDPYENVLCTECHLGGDDALMLLCDSCDSPAHTYCVGLGHEVPEGNWYCEGCRPIALGSSSSQVEGHAADQRTANNLPNISASPVMNSREGIDLNSFPSPHTTSSLGFGFLSSPRHSSGDGRAGSPVTGAGAPTLSGRRWVHRQIQNLLSRNRMTAAMANRDSGSGVSTANSNMGPPNCTIFGDRLPEISFPLVPNMGVLSSRLNNLRRQTVQNPDAEVADRTVDGTSWDRRGGVDYFPGFEQLHHYNSRPSTVSGDDVPPSTFGDDVYLHKEKEQVQSMVKTHLQSLSRDIGLDHTTLEEVARRSTHTTLAACGLEHAISEVCLEPQPFICPHVEIVAAGQTSLMKSSCPSCFDSFVRDVVKRILNTKLPPWLVGTRV